MRIILYIVNILIATLLILFSEESSAAYWLSVVKASPLQTFIAVSIIGFCAIFFFWNKLYEKFLKKIENWQKHKRITAGPVLKLKKINELGLTELFVFLLLIRIVSFYIEYSFNWKFMILISLIALIIIFVKSNFSKVARWVIKRHNYFEKHKDKKMVKLIRAWGLFGLYFGGAIPFCLHLTLCAQKIFIQSRFGILCIWLGATTRLAIEIFAGLKLINLIF